MNPVIHHVHRLGPAAGQGLVDHRVDFLAAVAGDREQPFGPLRRVAQLALVNVLKNGSRRSITKIDSAGPRRPY
jgi:hypothetical protein